VVEQLRREPVFGQVLVRELAAGWEIRSVVDREATELKTLSALELRAWVQTTATGAFRPLKSAPNLRPGWRVEVPDAVGMVEVLDSVYPGAVADWAAWRTGRAVAIGFRSFVERQTGMYRVAAMLAEEPAARVARACCAASFCLKRRLWTVPGLEEDAVSAKSVIPCLEPCALLLEFARKAMRIEQEEPVSVALAPSDWTTIREALREASQRAVAREGDVASAGNPRRALLTLAKLEAGTAEGEESGE
jgi:hypothetical protein